MEKYENVISETTPLNVPTKVVVPKGVLIKIKHLDMKQNQFEFKPFDQVLVRDCNNSLWNIDMYSHYVSDNNYHQCLKCSWNYCIPYNENTAHLLGTCEPYKEPEPKVWRIINSPSSFDEMYTNEELLNFIKTAVINNKDITNFHVMYIP